MRTQHVRLVQVVRRRDDDRAAARRPRAGPRCPCRRRECRTGRRARAPWAGRCRTMATSVTPRIFESTGRCVSCAIAPAPTTPMRTGSVMSPSCEWAESCASRRAQLDACQPSCRDSSAKNRAEVLAGARTADRAALAHADAMSIAAAVQRQRLHAVAPVHGVDGKVGAVQHLATRRAQRVAHLVARGAIRVPRSVSTVERRHAPGRRDVASR